MRRWDASVDAYLEEYVARGVSEGMIGNVERERTYSADVGSPLLLKATNVFRHRPR